MKKWFEINKWKVLLSCLFTLVPILVGVILWNSLPDTMTLHWGVDGAADGTGSKAMVVFLVPLIMCAVNLLCFCITAVDKNSREQGKKAMSMVFWIVPLISIAVNGVIYCLALDKEFNAMVAFPLLIGISFISVGNYLPKIKQNRTLGIKIKWTLQNEENWNKTHRLGGKVWVFSGIVILLTVFLPVDWMMAVFAAATVASVLLPMGYSYSIYIKHKKSGVEYGTYSGSQQDKRITRIVTALILLIFMGVGIIMFTGDIQYQFGEDTFEIVASFSEDLNVAYNKIEAVEYRSDCPIGYRKFGVGSAKLSMGLFEEEGLGEHTRYTYNACKDAVVLASNGKILVINAETVQQTQVLYNEILKRIG